MDVIHTSDGMLGNRHPVRIEAQTPGENYYDLQFEIDLDHIIGPSFCRSAMLISFQMGEQISQDAKIMEIL